MQSPEGACIVIDGTSLRYLYTGLGQFSYHLLDELGKRPPEQATILALVHPKYAKRVPPGVRLEPATWLRRHAPAFLQSALLPGCPVWHMTTENTRLTGIPSRAKVVLTIHGLHFLDEWNEDEATRELEHVQSLVNRATIITVVSAFTENLVRSRLKTGSRRIEVIPNGVVRFSGYGRRPDWAPKRKFLFTVGTFFKRKNFLVLLPMMQHLPEYDLVIAGDANQPYGETVRSAIARVELQGRVLLPGEVTEEEKHWLYQNAEAFVFPSVSEGFGIPLIESFHAGKPAFCSRYGSLPEVGGKLAFYWDTFDPETMAQLVRRKLEEEIPQLKEARRSYAGEYTWERAANRYREIYQSLIGS